MPCIRLLLIGKAAPNQQAYFKRCRREAAQNVSFLDHLPQQQLKEYYQKAKVHVLPSHFENIGLASIEAGAMNCNLVVSSKGFISEYLRDEAYYCDPCSEASIRTAIEQAAQAPAHDVLQERIRSDFNWRRSALITKEAYEIVLK